MANDEQPSPPPYSAKTAIRINEVEDLERGGSVTRLENQSNRAAAPAAVDKSTTSQCSMGTIFARVCSWGMFLTVVGVYMWLKMAERYTNKWFCAQHRYLHEVVQNDSIFWAYVFQATLEMFWATPVWMPHRNHAWNIFIITICLAIGVFLAPLNCKADCK